jgi:predicted nucleotidyltransferase
MPTSPTDRLRLENVPEPLRDPLRPALQRLVALTQPQGLWLFGSWARGEPSHRSDIDLLVMGLADLRRLDAYDLVLQTFESCPLPIQPLIAPPALLARHGDAPFWRTVKQEALPLLEGSRFP